MGHRPWRILQLIIAAAVLNYPVSWLCIAIHRHPACQWNPHHNPRNEFPLVCFVVRALGAEWASGCARSGTLLGNHRDEVMVYTEDPWWPPEAMDAWMGNFATSAGWPFRGLSSWRTIEQFALPNDDIGQRISDHWGIAIREKHGTKDDEYSSVLPLKPIWPGFIGNTIAYSIAIGLVSYGWMITREQLRLRQGRCLGCGYLVAGLTRCPECGLEQRSEFTAQT